MQITRTLTIGNDDAQEAIVTIQTDCDGLISLSVIDRQSDEDHDPHVFLMLDADEAAAISKLLMDAASDG